MKIYIPNSIITMEYDYNKTVENKFFSTICKTICVYTLTHNPKFEKNMISIVNIEEHSSTTNL